MRRTQAVKWHLQQWFTEYTSGLNWSFISYLEFFNPDLAQARWNTEANSFHLSSFPLEKRHFRLYLVVYMWCMPCTNLYRCHTHKRTWMCNIGSYKRTKTCVKFSHKRGSFLSTTESTSTPGLQAALPHKRPRCRRFSGSLGLCEAPCALWSSHPFMLPADKRLLPVSLVQWPVDASSVSPQTQRTLASS